MFSVYKILVFLMMCSVTLGQITQDFYANSDARLPRIHGHKHHYYRALLFHYVHGVIIVLVIIKIAMAFGFVGMLSVVTKMFAAIRFLFKDKEKEATPIYIHHDPHHSHHREIEYEPLGPGDKFHRRRGDPTNRVTNPNVYPGSYQGTYGPRPTNYGSGIRQDLAGGRSLGNDAAYSAQIKENKERRKRDLEQALNAEDSVVKMLEKRSIASPDENCMKKRVCMLHARARANPLYIFQLYFIKKDTMSKYWDHDRKKTFKDCIDAFPCHPEGVTEELKTTEEPSTTTTTTQKYEISFAEESGESEPISVEYEPLIKTDYGTDNLIYVED